MYLIKNNLFDNDLHLSLIKNNIGNNNEDDLDDSTFDLWKIELKKELPRFWKSMNKPLKSRRRFSHSI
ncbi:MAG: hypothetical protein ACQXXF_06250 [Thermoplasmatota archaeon]|jgi:hypothetical protein